MANTDLKQLVVDYIEAWSTTDAGLRKQLVQKVYSESAKFIANEPGDDAVSHQGLDGIYGNISQVNQRLVVGNGLNTECTGHSENHNTLRVSWTMKTHDGSIALKGMNFLQIDNSGKIERDYIFIN